MSKIIRITDRSSEAFNAYLKDIRHTEPLSTQEEHELARLSQLGDINARNTLVEANQLYVISCVNEFQNKVVPMDELVAAGRLGLIIAATRYNPEFEGRFITYAVHYIREYIRQAIADYCNTVRVPLHVKKAARKASPSVNDELDFNKLIDWEPKPIYDIICQPLDGEGMGEDEDYRSLIKTIAADTDTDALAFAMRESEDDLRDFLSNYYSEPDVNILMDYAHKYVNGYTIADLANEYRLPKKHVEKYIAQLLEKAKLLNLCLIYNKHAA